MLGGTTPNKGRAPAIIRASKPKGIPPLVIFALVAVAGMAGVAYYVRNGRPTTPVAMLLPVADTADTEQENASTLAVVEAENVDQTTAEDQPDIYYTKKENGQEVQQKIKFLPVPKDCHMEHNADYDGPALTWGLDYKKASAAECCQACKEFVPNPQPCNIWVWCGDPSGECWSPDIWNHTTGECWLKYQEQWDNIVDRSKSNLKINARGPYPVEFRQEHKTAPEKVPWTAGVIPAKRRGARKQG